MTALPEYIEAHKADSVRFTFTLAKILYPIPQCITDCEIPIIYGGDTYLPTAGFAVSGIQSSPEDKRAVSATITIGNADGAWGTMLAAITGADRNPVVQIFQAWLDPDAPSGIPVGVRGLLVGAVESDAWTPTAVSLTIGPSADLQAATLPWREVTTRCTYRRFKGSQCGYAGAATTCDRSYETCSALLNSTRFGGFRAIPQRWDQPVGMDNLPLGGGRVETIYLNFQRD